MVGARQLVRELLRERRAPFQQSHLPPTFAVFSQGTHQNERPFPDGHHVLYLSNSNNDDEQTSPPPGMTKRVSRGMSPFAEPEIIKSLSSQRVREYAFSVDSSHSFSNVHSRSLALSMLSHLRAGGTRQHLFRNICSPTQVGRYCSTASGQQLDGELGDASGIGESAEGFGVIDAGVATGVATPEVQAVSDVSAIIGDCSYPTAFLQLFIDFMHSQLGLPWWGAIVAATLVIRTCCVPLVAFQLKSSAKLSLMRPEMEKINARIKDSNYDPRVSASGREEMLALFKKHKTTPLSPFLAAVLQGPIFICFFFAIKNMCEKLESFKDGGFLWFADLSSVDSTYILPIILSATMLTTVELNALDGMEGNPYASKMKNYMRIFSVVLFPVSLSFEKALFFYWIPTNIFSLFQGQFFKMKAVKEMVGIPSTEHLADTTTADTTAVAPALTDASTRGSSGRKKSTPGRNKTRGSRRR